MKIVKKNISNNSWKTIRNIKRRVKMFKIVLEPEIGKVEARLEGLKERKKALEDKITEYERYLTERTNKPKEIKTLPTKSINKTIEAIKKRIKNKEKTITKTKQLLEKYEDKKLEYEMFREL